MSEARGLNGRSAPGPAVSRPPERVASIGKVGVSGRFGIDPVRPRSGECTWNLVPCGSAARGRRSRAASTSAAPVGPDRIGVFEQWDSPASVDTFRADAPDDSLPGVLVDASVERRGIASTTPLT